MKKFDLKYSLFDIFNHINSIHFNYATLIKGGKFEFCTGNHRTSVMYIAPH